VTWTPTSAPPSRIGGVRRPRTVAPATLAVGLALLLGACASSGDTSASSGGEAAAPGSAASAGADTADKDGAVAGPRAQAGGSGGSSAGAGGSGAGDAAAAADRRIVRTAEVTIEVRQLAPAATRIRQAATDLGGYVATETTGYSAPVAIKSETSGTTDAPVHQAQAGQSVLVLRIPESKLDQALARAAGVGTEVSRTSTADDVTGDIADLTSRTATQKASVARVRQLLADAKDLKDVVLLESELTRREADLEALEARLATLSNRADLATLTVVLQTPQVQDTTEEDNPFVRGLRSGWEALMTSTGMLITLIGGLLPFAAVAALVGLPLSLRYRSRRTASVPPSVPPSDPTP